MNTERALIYNNLRSAKAFHAGFVAERVIVKIGGKFGIVTKAKAKKLKLKIVWPETVTERQSRMLRAYFKANTQSHKETRNEKRN